MCRKDEILKTPQYLDYLDIMNIYNCGESRARAIIREIKKVSDRLKLAGKVSVSDYDVWFNKGVVR